MMEQGHHRHFLRQGKPSFLPKAIPMLAVFSLGCALGFFLASTDQIKEPNSDQRIVVTTGKQNNTPCPSTREEQVQELPPHDLFQFRTKCAPPIHNSDILPTLVRHIYNGTSPFAGFPPPHAAPLLRDRRVRGWGSNGAVFEELIKSVRPKTIIEVGTFLGASALHMANLTRQLRLDSTILCLDDFRGWPGFRNLNRGAFRDIRDVNGDVFLMYQFMQNVVDSGEDRRVLPVPFSTAAGLAALCELGVYGDLVEVDAGHDFHSAWLDINMAWAVVKDGGVMFGHDYFTAADRHGVRRAVQLFAKVKGLTVKPNGQHWVLFPPKGEEMAS